MARKKRQAEKRRRGFALSQSILDRLESEQYIPTYDEVKSLYGPVKTLGAPKEAVMAMDSSLSSSGAYTLIQHAWEHGQGYALGPSFMGYAALSSLTQNGLIRACIETVANDMTREWIEIKAVDTDGQGDGTDDNKAIEDALIDLKVKDIFNKAAEYDGYFGGCMIFIDTGATDNQLLTPLDVSEKSGELKSFRRFVLVEPINIFPGRYESTDPLSSQYFNPDTWWILGKEVHVSRLIRICGKEVPVLLKPSYNFMGMPQAQLLYDYVIHFQDSRAAVSRLLEKFSLTVMKTDMEDILTNPHSTKSLDGRLAYMARHRSNDGVLAIDKEMEDIVKLETPLSGVTDIVRQTLEFIVAINRTPAVKLLGVSPSGFNATGESDIKNYNDHVKSQQEKVLRAGLQKALDIIQVVKLGRLDKSVKFNFVDLNEDDAKSTAETQKIKTDRDVSLVDAGVISEKEARRRLSVDPDSDYFSIDVDEVPEANHGQEEIENGAIYTPQRGTGEGILSPDAGANSGNGGFG
ncbi:DUF1073 domain-containing protein [Xenorhabdus bovienii]|uniref:Anti-CBASS protein Acb1-like N-terminal domain-containing protein n=1 Tax=Xenorhabdus bovienii str. Intermedium TaxID=1379677 RepID=A0A077QKU3_XENBV|nr:DUF1073 domain-containing protein [Xenorhabdus bovienii]CDH33885.1 conserved hypothetical protein [Xenorhabdus bovienii str. Intermedium]